MVKKIKKQHKLRKYVCIECNEEGRDCGKIEPCICITRFFLNSKIFAPHSCLYCGETVDWKLMK